MRKLRHVIALILALPGALAVNTANALQYWSTTTTANWSTGNWSVNGSTTCGTSTWGNGGNVDARIPCSTARGHAITINIAADVTVGSITGFINTTGTDTPITINGPSRLIFTSAGDAMYAQPSQTITLNCVLADSSPSGGFFSAPANDGTFVLNGANTYSTTSVLGRGTGVGGYTAGNNAAFGTSRIFLQGGATIQGSGSAITLSNPCTFAAATNGTIGGSTALTFSGPLTFGTTAYFFTLNSTADTIFSGAISDSGGGFQVKAGTGRLVVLNGSNTYAGWTDLVAGKLAIGGSPNALGATGNNWATLVMHAASASGCSVGTYGGPQTVTSGQPGLFMDANGTFNNTNTLTFASQYAMDVGNGPSSTLALNNTADVIIGGVIISANGLGTTTSTGTGTSGGIILTGTGRIVFATNNSAGYTGDTYVNGPVLKIANTSGVATGNGGAVRLNGSTVNGSGTLTGSGTAGTVFVNSFGVLAPGDYPNLTATNLSMGTLNLTNNGAYKCVITAPTGTAGTNWSLASCSTLNVNASSGSPFILDVTFANSGSPGLPAGFDPTQSYTWQILKAASAINNFAANKFAIYCNALPPATLSLQQSGNALNLVYTPPATAATAGVNGLSGQYFDATSPTNGTVQITRLDPNINFPSWTADQQTIQEVTGDNWAAEWTGLLVPTVSGTYTISTTSDDGSSVYLNGTQIVNNWFSQGLTTRGNAAVTLTAGVPTPIRMTYYNGVSGEGVWLSWTPPGGSSNAVPQSALYASPYITAQPVSQTANAGSSVTFTATATNGTCPGTSAPTSGGGPAIPAPTYQWQQNGTNLASATTSTYNIPSAGTGDAGAYTVLVGNSAASMLSGTATLLLNQTITFGSLTDQTYGNAPFNLTATADSGLGVTYTSSDPTVAIVSGNTVTILKQGPVTIFANQAGNAIYAAAPQESQSFTVNPLPVTLSGARPYDGSASAGFVSLSVGNAANGDNVTVASGSGTLAGANAGSQGITAFGTLALGNNGAGNYTLAGASGSVMVTALPVTLSGTRVYDGSAAAGSAILSVANAVGGDNVNVASGSGTLASANAGSQAIAAFGTLALGNNGAGNYTLAGASGSVTITNASTLNLVAASPNPSLPASNVTFTATLSAVPASIGLPTGAVQFKTNGVALGDPIALDGMGVATLITNTLPHGSNTVTAEYAGDGNFLGSTGSVALIVNTPPTARDTNAGVTANQSLVLSVAKLLLTASDADASDTLSVTVAGPISTNGPANNVVLDTNAGTITYTPATNYVGLDSFTYTVSDNYGGTATPSVVVTVASPDASAVTIVLPPAILPDGHFHVGFSGIPGYSYTIQYSPNPSGGPWMYLTSLTAGPAGLFEFEDPTQPAPASRFYRTVYP